MDEGAISEVKNASGDIFFLTAVAPKVMVDTVIFTLRSSFLVRRIAISYGARPGPIARVRLVREAVRNVAMISLADLIVSDVVGVVGSAAGHVTKVGLVGAAALIDPDGNLASVTAEAANFVGELSNKVAEDVALGLVSARRMALFGLLIIAACRPTGLRREKKVEIGRELGKKLLEFGRPTKQT